MESRKNITLRINKEIDTKKDVLFCIFDKESLKKQQITHKEILKLLNARNGYVTVTYHR